MSEPTSDLLQCVQQASNLFHYFAQDELGDIPGYFSLRKVSAGDTVWHEGDSCDYMIFIAAGHLEVKKETEFKGRQITLGVYGPGSIAGELCMLDQKPRAVTASAIEDASLIVLTSHRFDRLLEEYPALGIKLLKGMLLSTSSRLRQSFDRLVTIF